MESLTRGWLRVEPQSAQGTQRRRRNAGIYLTIAVHQSEACNGRETIERQLLCRVNVATPSQRELLCQRLGRSIFDERATEREQLTARQTRDASKMKEIPPEERVIIALDVRSLDAAENVVRATGQRAVVYKIGSELFTRCGPSSVELVKRHGKEVFLDLKFHDIPNTVSRAVEAAASLGVKMLNVHASGGAEMMRAAVEAAGTAGSGQRPKVLAVTVLTSIDEGILAEDIGCPAGRGVEEQVVHLAELAAKSGLDGVVASAREASLIRQRVGSELLIVTPGIRPQWAARGDQRRITTPAEALRAGADYIVIGRPVTASADPKGALERIIAEISGIQFDETR